MTIEIELQTSKKKLTKSIINQMIIASLFVLKNGVPLGYVVNIRNGMTKAIVIKHDINYYVISANFRKLKQSVYYKKGKWSVTTSFNSEEDCNVWWEHYSKILKQTNNQIYV